MDNLILSLIHDWQISRQGQQTASLTQRVTSLEEQVTILHHVVLALAKELRPDLLEQLEAPAPPAPPQREDESRDANELPEGACLSCGQLIPEAATACTACGWTWWAEQFTSASSHGPPRNSDAGARIGS